MQEPHVINSQEKLYEMVVNPLVPFISHDKEFTP